MGQTKQLLPWGETTVLGQTLANLALSLVHDTLVVTGHERREIATTAASQGAPVVHNPDFAAGEMLSSLQVAISKLPADRSAVLVMLADQPMVGRETINKLLAAYWQGRGPLVAPLHDGRRGNPVIIDRRYFEELLALPPGAAPRALLQRHPDDLYLLDVDDPAVLLDLDNPDDYQRWRPGS
jgi:molybdenum cofactor cytidylyltransferase